MIILLCGIDVCMFVYSVNDQIKDEFDFFIVYIREAHAIGEWELEGNYKIHNAKTINERINALNYRYFMVCA